MYLRMTDLLVDALDRYQPEAFEEDDAGLVTEESAGVQPFGVWEVVAGAAVTGSEDAMRLLSELGLEGEDGFDVQGEWVSVPVDLVAVEDLVALLEAVDAACEILEVSGEVDVHERSITWLGSGEDAEPMPMPLPRPGDAIPHLVEEFAIHLKRHAAGRAERAGPLVTLQVGVELYGRPYVLVRDEVEDDADVRRLLNEAGVPAPEEVHAHRVEWAEDALAPPDVHAIVNALRDANPVVGFAAGVTWRNEPLQVEEPGTEPAA